MIKRKYKIGDLVKTGRVNTLGSTGIGLIVKIMKKSKFYNEYYKVLLIDVPDHNIVNRDYTELELIS